MLDSMAFSGPASIITMYFNESAHMTIPLIKRANLHISFFFFCDWFIFFFILEFYFAIFLPTMAINPRLYEKKPFIGTIYNYLLTINFYFHCAIWYSSYSIKCCTAICSTVISVGFKEKLIPVASKPLSLPLAYILVQVMFGVGSPSAKHSKVILGSPSTTTTLLLTLLNSGGSV